MTPSPRMNVRKIYPRAECLVRGPAEDDKQIDTTDDVDLLLSELLALRVLAEDMAEVLKRSYDVEYYPADGRTEQDIALAAYRVEYPEEK